MLEHCKNNAPARDLIAECRKQAIFPPILHRFENSLLHWNQLKIQILMVYRNVQNNGTQKMLFLVWQSCDCANKSKWLDFYLKLFFFFFPHSLVLFHHAPAFFSCSGYPSKLELL